MNILEILKEHFDDVLTPEVEKEILNAWELALNEKVVSMKDEVTVEIEEDMKSNVTDGFEKLSERVEVYIDKANDKFIAKNMKTEQAEVKVNMAVNLFNTIVEALRENNLEVDIEKKDIVGTLEAENKKLEESLNDSVNELADQKSQIFEYEKALSVVKLTSKMTSVQKEELKKLIENIACKNLEDFESKVQTAINIISKQKPVKEGDDDADADDKSDDKDDDDMLKEGDDGNDDDADDDAEDNEDVNIFLPKAYRK